MWQLRVSDGAPGTQDTQQAQELLNSIQSSHKFDLLLVNSKWQVIQTAVDNQNSAAQWGLGRLENSFGRRELDLGTNSRDAVIFGLEKLAESRDPDTGCHLERNSLYSTRLTSELRRSAKFCDQITPAFVRLIGTPHRDAQS